MQVESVSLKGALYTRYNGSWVWQYMRYQWDEISGLVMMTKHLTNHAICYIRKNIEPWRHVLGPHVITCD